MNEAEIRAHLTVELAKQPESVGAAFICEMFVDSFARRADLIVANGKLSAFEIKSERDSLDRLEGQLATYLKYFEHVTVVCAERHVRSVVCSSPASVGVWAVAADATFRVVRPARDRIIRSKNAWLSFLPVDEIRRILREHGVTVAGPRSKLLERSQSIPLLQIREYVLGYLKRREERVARLVQERRDRSAGPVAPPDGIQQLRSYLSRSAGAGMGIVAIPRQVR